MLSSKYTKLLKFTLQTRTGAYSEAPLPEPFLHTVVPCSLAHICLFSHLPNLLAKENKSTIPEKDGALMTLYRLLFLLRTTDKIYQFFSCTSHDPKIVLQNKFRDRVNCRLKDNRSQYLCLRPYLMVTFSS